MFDMKPEIPESTGNTSSNVTPEQWTEWNEYYYNLLNVSEKPSTNGEGEVKPNYFNKSKSVVGIANVFVDCGFQEQKEAEYDSEEAIPLEGEEFSAEELAVMEKWPSNTYKWKDGKVGGKRVKVVPKQPAQEYAIFLDFPSIMVDWTKHPIEALHSLGQKPLRLSLNGYIKFTKGGFTYEGFAKRFAFDPNYKTKKISTKSPLYKLADAMGVAEEYVSSGYNLGVLAGKAVMADIVIERNNYEGKDYFNTSIKKVDKIKEIEAGDLKITIEQQIPKCDIEPQAIPLNLKEGCSYDETALGSVKHDKGLKAVLPRMAVWQPSPKKNPDWFKGVKFEDTTLFKALGAATEAQQSQGEQSQQVNNKPAEKASPEPVQEQSSYVDPEPDMEWDDTIPF